MAYLKFEAKSNNTVYLDAASGTLITLNHVQNSVTSNNMSEQFDQDDFELIEQALDNNLAQ